MRNYIEEFSHAMLNQGITPPRNIIATGKIERFSINGKSAKKNGWYILFDYPILAGAFGDWRTGETHSWSSKRKDQICPKEWVIHRRQIQEARRQQEHLKRQGYLCSAARANEIWNAAASASPYHPYLAKKKINPFLARQSGNTLILPVLDFKERLWSLQFIYPDGSKRLLSGGSKTGHFIPVSGKLLPSSQFLECEGFATGATLARAHPHACVISAIDAGNLKPVAINARSHFPHTEIIICADDDRQTPGNPGITKGREAALAARTFFASPEWPKNAPITLSDFNDLACWLIGNQGGQHE